MPSSLLQVINSLFQNLSQQLGTSSANTTCWQLVNRFVTTCLQTCNNLCIFTSVGKLCAWFTQYNSSCKQVACDSSVRQKLSTMIMSPRVKRTYNVYLQTPYVSKLSIIFTSREYLRCGIGITSTECVEKLTLAGWISRRKTEICNFDQVIFVKKNIFAL
jgi:hypothetical protein